MTFVFGVLMTVVACRTTDVIAAVTVAYDLLVGALLYPWSVRCCGGAAPAPARSHPSRSARLHGGRAAGRPGIDSDAPIYAGLGLEPCHLRRHQPVVGARPTRTRALRRHSRQHPVATMSYKKRGVVDGVDYEPMKEPRYAELATFMRAPLAASLDEVDIGLIGVPTDLGVTNRPGARHGPREIRNSSSLMRAFNLGLRMNPYDLCRIADIGDVRFTSRYD